MQPIRILIVEDEWIVSEEIRELLVAQGYDVVGQADDAETALDILQQKQTDVALLDVKIKGKRDGIALAEEIVQHYNCAIIFLTAFGDNKFINRAKAVRPAAYMIKPFEAKNLQAAIEIAFNNLMDANQPPNNDSYIISDYIFLKENTRFKKIALKDILYVEANGSYISIFLDSGKTTLAINLKAFEENLRDTSFMRIHRSYVVNLLRVDEYEGNQLFIKNTPIPISTAHKSEFMHRFRFI